MALPVLYPLRSVDTGIVTYTECEQRRRRVTIDHRPLAGVTPAMLLDWFTHLGETMSYGGRTVPRYHAWHPIDHIHWGLARPASNGGAAEGAAFHMVEAFGARPEYKIDEVASVEKLDQSGIRLVKRVAGITVFRLEHTWSLGSGGTHYITTMDLGTRSSLLAPVNRVVCMRFPDDKVRAWVKHNIEEVGQLEYLLPQLLSSGKAKPPQRTQGGDGTPCGEHREPEPVH